MENALIEQALDNHKMLLKKGLSQLKTQMNDLSSGSFINRKS